LSFASLVSLVAALVGLAASVASLIDYLGAVPRFCTETGCATVRASSWSHPLGIPLPLPGIGFFAAMLALAVITPQRARLRKALAVAGGAVALGLVALQAFVIGAWCKLCLCSDGAALGTAVTVLAGAGTVRWSWHRLALAAPAIAALTFALAWIPHAREPALAAGMADALFAAPADELTPERCEQLAVDVGCDRARYRAALADPAPSERITRDTADARAGGIRGFPTIFIGDQRLTGAGHEAAELLAMLDRARAPVNRPRP
jgi:uncharacterized membrane protein